jgi:hypothetical protein
MPIQIHLVHASIFIAFTILISSISLNQARLTSLQGAPIPAPPLPLLAVTIAIIIVVWE